MDQKIKIVGGGFSGLVQAFYLVQAGFKPVIFEKKRRLGGLIASHHLSSGLVEQAAGSFLANAELEKLSRILGVSLVPTLKRGKKKFIYRYNKKCRWPLSLGESLPLLLKILFKGGLKRSLKDVREGETLKQWGQRCWGDPAVRFILEPAMQGVYAVSSDQLSAPLVLDSLLKRSPKGFYKGSVAPREGMGEWMGAMKSYLESKGCEFVKNHPFERKDNGPVFWAVDLASLKEIGKKQEGWLPPEVNKTRTTGLSSLTLIFENQNLQPEGFGCLFPRGFGFYSLGVLFNHNIFEGRAAEKGSSETWIFGDHFTECENHERGFVNFSGMGEEELLHCVLSDRYQLTGGSEYRGTDLNGSLPGKQGIVKACQKGKYRGAGSNGSLPHMGHPEEKAFKIPGTVDDSFSQTDSHRDHFGKKVFQKVKIFQWPDCLPVYDENLGNFIEALDRKTGEDFFIGNYLGQLGLSEILIRAKTNAEKFKNIKWISVNS